MLRFLLLLPIFALVMACSQSGEDLDEAPIPLGNFKLAHNIVIASKAVKGPLSREASEEELTSALKDAIDARFGRYEGEKLYHFGVSVEGYVLAQPGVPLVVSPKSILVVRVTVWDDAAGKKLNEEPEQMTIFESLSGETALGSGLTQSAEEQLHNLTVNAAKRIERFLAEKQAEEGWFVPDPVTSDELDVQTDIDPAAIVVE
ncbi:MAG: hypothetical protein ABJL99_20335 [Aliishimia sp.]